MRRAGQGPQRHTSAPKVEPRARAINPGGVNMLGNHVGDHTTNRDGTGFRGESLVRGSGYNAPRGPTNMAAAGAGAGRTIYSSGSQGTQGQPASGNPRPNAQRNALEGE